MTTYILTLPEIDRTKVLTAGGKAANLGELTKIPGLNVPQGFCLTTDAYKNATHKHPRLTALLTQLNDFQPEEREAIGKIGLEIRSTIKSLRIPGTITGKITAHLNNFTEKTAFAIRSSATAEDLPTASFAGQQDSYLNIIGKQSILNHITRCWASLFTDRAIIYRTKNGFDHRQAQLAVIVQQMIFPQASGILFTADPITSDRKLLSIDASFGLGEALVSGLVNPDNYKVRDGRIVDKNIATKKLAVYGLSDGGTETRGLRDDRQTAQTLTDKQILQLATLGTQIQQHFRHPQDIEWCLDGDTFCIVQTRPITTLFPVPEANDNENHVYVSVGHQQMMTDAIKPLGLSFFQLFAVRPMFTAGGRLFVDVTQNLSTPAGQQALLNTLGKSDPLLHDALSTIASRENFIKPPAESQLPASSILPGPLSDPDPAVVSDLINSTREAILQLKQDIRTRSGSDLFDFILDDIVRKRKALFDQRSLSLIITAMNAAFWINDKMNEWLGEVNVADTLSQSVPNNITSEMGRDLMNVADAIRPYPRVIEYLQQVKNDNFLSKLAGLKGGRLAGNAIGTFLDKYGMRCAGEIDITKPRWSEKPITIIPMILSNIKNVKPNAAGENFEQGRQAAKNKEQDLLVRLRKLPDGEQKANETKRMIGLVRNFSGYREYPKYGMVSRSFIYKQAILKEAEHLVQANVIKEKEDVYYLSFEEFHTAVLTNRLDQSIISRRKDEYKGFEKLTPPRLITSDGEIITGQYKRTDLPAKAIPGLAVSSGIVEGRARIILNLDAANLETGDILVTKFTDPSWTPLFVAIKGLVAEVGGLMTHGSVIAREYGLPAVVGVESVTTLIKDGQMIRVNGTGGYIEIISPSHPQTH